MSHDDSVYSGDSPRQARNETVRKGPLAAILGEALRRPNGGGCVAADRSKDEIGKLGVGARMERALVFIFMNEVDWGVEK